MKKFFERIFGAVLPLEDVVVPAVVAAFISLIIGGMVLITVYRISP